MTKAVRWVIRGPDFDKNRGNSGLRGHASPAFRSEGSINFLSKPSLFYLAQIARTALSFYSRQQIKAWASICRFPTSWQKRAKYFYDIVHDVKESGRSHTSDMVSVPKKLWRQLKANTSNRCAVVAWKSLKHVDHCIAWPLIESSLKKA